MQVDIVDVEDCEFYPLSEVELGVDIVWFIDGLLDAITVGLEKMSKGLVVAEPLCEEASATGVLAVYMPVSLHGMEPMCVRVAHIGAGYWQWEAEGD